MPVLFSCTETQKKTEKSLHNVSVMLNAMIVS